jgi:hypothetical protein
MSKFKVGDRVKVTRILDYDVENGISVGDVMIMIEDTEDGCPWCKTPSGKEYAMVETQLELATNVPPPAWNGRVTVDGKEYKVEWKHDRWDDGKDKEVVQFINKAYTTCFIIKDDCMYGIGQARCSWKDNFSRKVGRKLSLQRALDDSNFDAGQRQQIWEQVLAVKGLVR